VKKLVVLIPAFNEEAKLESVIKKIPREISKTNVIVLVVNDGSTDKTREVAKKNGAIVVSHQTNYGVGRAFQTGLQKALELGADYMVNIDADGQFSPSEIKKLIDPIIKKEAEYVVSDRFLGKDSKLRMPANMPKDKYYGNLLMAKLISFLAGQRFNDVSCGFRAYSKRAMLMLDLMGKFTYTQESFIDLATKGIKIKAVPVSVKYFTNRKSRVANNVFIYAIRTLNIIFRTFRDYRPLLFFFFLSIIPMIISLLSGGFLLIHFLNTGSFSPYKIVGFIFIYFSAFTFGLWAIGFLADMFTRIRIYQEKILFYEKEKRYKKNG